MESSTGLFVESAVQALPGNTEADAARQACDACRGNGMQEFAYPCGCCTGLENCAVCHGLGYFYRNTPRVVGHAARMRDNLVSHDNPMPEPSSIALGAYQRSVAFAYAEAPSTDYRLVTSYDALMRECIVQFDAMRQSGVDVVFCDEDPTPTVDGRISYRAFVKEVQDTGILRVFRSAPDDHPILCRHAILHAGQYENLNSIFRAVHDWFGHCASGGFFNWRGETTAYYSHASMFSVAARAALFSETVAQQCWYAIHGDYAPQKCVHYGANWHNPPLS